ncbi:MAG: Methionine synthase vitamin-B12 independent [Frankiales bacterium]|nr:Methionine synthase vitamin-B12 independent [Frankiales bacterium]
MTTLWRSGTVTGIGSLPGKDPSEAARFLLDELPIPHLAELPDRGWHADIAGRGAALLADLYVDLQPSGWRIVPRASRDGQRARDLLARDVDALEKAAEHSAPDVLKVQATGPWTLASLLELHRGAKVLSDHGAMADLAQSLAEGLKNHVADVQRRLPGTTIVMQLDEPSLPAVLAARIPTASGFGTFRAPKPELARDRLRTVLAVTEHTVIHCCAPDPPLALMGEAAAVSFDASLPFNEWVLGELLEKGKGLLLGVVPAVDGSLPSVKKVLENVGRVRDRSGATDVTLTPACGMAGASEAYVRAALKRLLEAAEALEEGQQ